MCGVILGFIPAIILGVIFFLINPILGVLWIIWLAILVIYSVKKDLIMKFLGWLFGAKK
jgi:4-hydroxybenzoate polyprenyltransferase